MFEFFFKYPPRVFEKGDLVLLGSWPVWVLILAIACASSLLGWVAWKRNAEKPKSLQGRRGVILWALQSALLALLLLMLWQPAISISALKPEQNIIAVVVDDSGSMGLSEDGTTRIQQARNVLQNDLLRRLKSHFQVRLYRLGSDVQRVAAPEELNAAQQSTQISSSLKQITQEADTLPIGSVVLLSDGVDTTGGIKRDTLQELKRHKLPVNTIGFGRQTLDHDIEIDDLDVAPQALMNSRLQADVTIRQKGFSGQHATLTLTGGGKVLASRDILLKEAAQQREALDFNAGDAGVKSLEVKISQAANESNTENNRLPRVLYVTGGKRRLLYIEGEPRWDYKFIRRAVEDDPALQVVSMLRTTQNKMYRQGIANEHELEDGFPSKMQDLFDYQGIIFGSIETGYFTATQRELIQQFVDRRGGGVLFLGGRASLADGGYQARPFSELLPVQLPVKPNTFQRTLATAELTAAGKESLLCRIDDDAQKSAAHWDILPYLANYQDPGIAKPGALVLARTSVNGKKLPLLVTENYGRGRTAVFATGGSWRWRMQQPVADKSQEIFWRQMLRWVVSPTPSRVVALNPSRQLFDQGQVEVQAEVRDACYVPTNGAEVEAHIVKPDGSAEDVVLRPETQAPGRYRIDWNATQPGSYIAEIKAKQNGHDLGSDVLTFNRENGTAEHFRTQQNREALQRLSTETGGRYYLPKDANNLADEISYSEAGINAREMKDLWSMPIVFILLLLLRASEWLLRRKWGAI